MNSMDGFLFFKKNSDIMYVPCNVIYITLVQKSFKAVIYSLEKPFAEIGGIKYFPCYLRLQPFSYIEKDEFNTMIPGRIGLSLKKHHLYSIADHVAVAGTIAGLYKPGDTLRGDCTIRGLSAFLRLRPNSCGRTR